MKLYNTLTRKTEDFIPSDPKNVKIYTCGPTVYNYQHIGNFAAYIYWDTLIRTLRANGWQENRVLNITDVGHLASDADDGEDKLEKGAKREGKTVWEIAEYYTDDFLENFRKLNLIEPTKITKATDYIEANISLIKTLTEKGYTYETKDGIYYDTSKFPAYADFAHLDLNHLKAGARVDFNPEKRNPADFALWKFIQPGEKHDMNWDSSSLFSKTVLENQTQDETQERERVSPLRGYPGWHIECSSIIHSELGEPIDIHTGGIDHIPIHHTNEIAQSEAAYDKPLSRFWLHNNFITIDGEKISKSLGNTYTFNDLADHGFTHLDFRLWTLQGQFQSERNFTFESLAAAKTRLQNYRNFAALRHQDVDKELVNEAPGIIAALNDNLNTPMALAVLDQIITTTKPTEDFILYLDNIFGLALFDSTPDISKEQKQLIADRIKAKSEKDFKTADEIRKSLETQGITLLDSQTSSIWQY